MNKQDLIKQVENSLKTYQDYLSSLRKKTEKLIKKAK
jgi:Ni2+-binding GTPase involved in maturation of urease and hydrogenase